MALTTIRRAALLGQAGNVVQVQRTLYTSTTSYSISAATDTALTDLTVSITPTSSSSQILIQAHIYFEGSTQDHNYQWFFYRDSTAVKHAASSNRRVGISAGQTAYYADDKASTPSSAVYQYFDSPSSTSAITYKVGVNSYNANTLYINRSVSDTDTSDYERGLSYISVTEIAG